MPSSKSRWMLGIVVLVSTPLLLAQGRGGGWGTGSGAGGNCAAVVAELPRQEVDASEAADLRFMREEEKLARDVYRALEDRWGVRAFHNISQAEQQHMDATLALLSKYEIDDPVGADSEGTFVDPRLQQLYSDLVAKGQRSVVDALEVGATIEDLDLADLDRMLGRTDNEDIGTVYQNLSKGSRNHLRAFVGLLDDQGATYTPQYLSPGMFQQIVDSSWERGRVDARGNAADCPYGCGPGTHRGRGPGGRHGCGHGGQGGGRGGSGCARW